MPITVSGTQITFNDGTNQTTAFTGGGGFSSVVGYNSPATFTAPANVNRVQVVLVSGGGGGGGSPGGASGAAPGKPGGPGIVAMGYYTVTPNTSYPVTVGAAGNGGPPGPTGGGTGGVSSFGNLLTANGGNGGGTFNGSPGNPGTAPLAQTSLVAGRTAAGIAMANGGFNGDGGPDTGDGGPATPGNPGGPGRVLVYF